MYIKIENNKVTQWADWEFEGSHFVDINHEEYSNDTDRFELINEELIDIKNTEKYKNKQRLKEITKELKELDELFYKESQNPIEYNNHLYKFEWTSLYQNILNSGILPAKIWDITELEENAIIMNEEDLQKLQNHLIEIQETAFQTRKEARSLLLKEKEVIESKAEE